MRPVRSAIVVLLGFCVCSGQEVENYEGNDQSSVSARKSQDVSILKQIHRHNEDGSYTYGFEGSDGSFKIETKSRAGEVSGKYGYVDDVGKLRVVEYGANKYGFQPSGEGITVPSPTLVELNEEPAAYEETPVKKPKTPKRTNGPLHRKSGAEINGNDFVPIESARTGLDGTWNAPTSANSYRSDESNDNYPKAAAAAVPSRPILANAHRVAADGGRFEGAARPRSLVKPSPPVDAVPEERPEFSPVSGSFQSEQDFGGRRSSAVDGSYRISEESQDQEPATQPPPLYRPSAKPARRNLPARTTGPRQSASRHVPRPGGILDQLAEQYALPQTGSPVSHSVSFGTDY